MSRAYRARIRLLRRENSASSRSVCSAGCCTYTLTLCMSALTACSRKWLSSLVCMRNGCPKPNAPMTS